MLLLLLLLKPLDAYFNSISSCSTRCLLLLFIFNRSNVSQLVTLHVDSKPCSVLCHMGDFGCGDGGWTPVMKIDGSKVSHQVKPIN